MKDLPRITLGSGASMILEGRRWKAEGDVPPELMGAAARITEDYQYTPSDGYPGYALAAEVAKAVGGKLHLPPVPDLPDGVYA